MNSLLVNNKPISYYLDDPRRTGEIHSGLLDELLQDHPSSEHLHYLKLVQQFLITGDWDRDLLTQVAAHTNDRQVLHRRMASVAELTAVSRLDSQEIVESPLTDERPKEQAGPAAALQEDKSEPEVIKTRIVLDLEEKKYLQKQKNPKKKKKKKSKDPKQKRSRLDKALQDLQAPQEGASSSDFVEWLKKLEDLSSVKGQKKGLGKKKRKKKKRKTQPVLDKTPISETLAALLAKQGRVEQARAMYEQLSLKYPEKSGFFAAKIKALANKN